MEYTDENWITNQIFLVQVTRFEMAICKWETILS